jgi:hypothetical protein
MSKNPERRAKALDRLSTSELTDLVRTGDLRTEIRQEALERLPEEQLLALVQDGSIGSAHDLLMSAVERLQQPSSLAAVALDPSLKEDVRTAAILRIDDEEVLVACAHDKSLGMYYQEQAFERMRTGRLIAQMGLETHLASAAESRLKELGDEENLRWMIMNGEHWQPWAAKKYAKDYARDIGFLKELCREARSEAMRVAALRELKHQGCASPQMRAEARERIRELMTANADWDLVRDLIDCVDSLGSLDPAERDYLYALLYKNPLDYQVLNLLCECDDPAGPAFMVLHDKLYLKGRRVSDEELSLLLDVPEDAALDYLKAFIRVGHGGNTELGSPRHMIGTCARAIYMMHANGRARERIERELPSHAQLRISDDYQDSENAIRSRLAVVDVTYWE